jgi:predicted nucleic acid-binding Zn ribbon protein
VASPSVTYTFSNSTTADATQVNQNFTDIINGLTDGTKDLSISALTCAGTATLNGNVAIGNSSSDTLTITSVLSSSLAVGTTFSYDLGAATVGFRSLYLGSNDSAARSVRLIGGAVSASYTITLPTATASQTGMTLISDASSVWSYRYAEKTTSKTANFTCTGDETVITCDASSGAFTLTLPAAANFTGKHFYIKKTDSSTNAVTIDGNSSETIDGQANVALKGKYSSIKVVCDGSNWHTVARNMAPTVQKFTSGSGTYTTPVNPSPLFLRVRMVGGGGGGAGSGTGAGTAGGAGGNTTFGTTLLVANGGAGVAWAAAPGAGGTASLGAGPVGLALSGGTGGGVLFDGSANTQGAGGVGGASAFGGAGSGGGPGGGGGAGATNTGGGGGGGGRPGTGNAYSGAGGGAGGFVSATIVNPDATYSYSVGAAGTAGTAGTSGHAGGAGGSGVIIVEEYYQ